MRVRSEAELAVLRRIRGADVVKEALPKVAKDKSGKEPPSVQIKPICLLVGHMHNLLNDKDMENE
jgi:hypothetical protein